MRLAPALLVLCGLVLTGSGWGAGLLIEGAFQNKSGNWWREGAVLDADFAKDRYYFNGSTYSGISNFLTATGASFSRSTTGTYVNSSGLVATAAANTPRMNYNGSTLESQGLLIEGSSTNLVTYSEDFTGANWNKTAAVTFTLNAGTAPDGSNNAVLVSTDGTVINYFNKTGLASMAGQTVTRSIYAKAGTKTTVTFEIVDTTNCANVCGVTYNLSTGVATYTVKPGIGQVSMLKLANGWYRLSVTFTYSAGTTGAFTVYPGCYGICTGNLYVWGAQLETRAYVTSYIPTTSATVTRNADSFSIPKGTWFDSTKGTFLATSFGQPNAEQIGYSRIIGGDNPLSFIGYGNQATSTLTAWNGVTSMTSPASTSFTYPTTTLTKPIKAAFAWDESTSSYSIFAPGQVGTGTISGGDFSSVTAIYPGGSNYDAINAPISRMTYYSSKLDDAFLKGMVP